MAKLTMATTALAKRRETLKTQPIFAVFLAIYLSEGQFLWRPSTYFIFYHASDSFCLYYISKLKDRLYNFPVY